MTAPFGTSLLAVPPGIAKGVTVQEQAELQRATTQVHLKQALVHVVRQVGAATKRIGSVFRHLSDGNHPSLLSPPLLLEKLFAALVRAPVEAVLQ
jgi:hypothetical protein